MSAVRSWTLQDLERMPDDGNRYEVVRGELFVTPAPSYWHQIIVARLAQLLTPYVLEDAGIPEYWMVDRESRSVRIALAGSADTSVTERMTWHPAGAPRPLEFAVGRLFD